MDSPIIAAIIGAGATVFVGLGGWIITLIVSKRKKEKPDTTQKNVQSGRDTVGSQYIQTQNNYNIHMPTPAHNGAELLQMLKEISNAAPEFLDIGPNGDLVLKFPENKMIKTEDKDNAAEEVAACKDTSDNKE